MKFAVDRKTWFRGQGTEQSTLLNPVSGMKCCLGLYGLACGLFEIIKDAIQYN